MPHNDGGPPAGQRSPSPIEHVVDADVVAFVRLGASGHRGQGVSLFWRVPVPDLVTAQACLPLLGLPADLLDELWPQLSTVEVGREGSSVVYVTVPYWTGQRHSPAGASQRIPEPDRRALAQRLRDLGGSHGASEVSVTSGVRQGQPSSDWRGVPADPYQVRLWWD